MSRFDLGKHYRSLSRSLDAQYRIATAYAHRGTKGQMREDHLIDTLHAIAPDDLRFFKGEVCDSAGRRSPEFDIVVTYRSDAIRLYNSPTNQVVPVETVLAVIEVKSMLSKDSVEKFDSDMKIFNSFERYYQPTQSYRFEGDITGNREYADFPGHPITPMHHLRGVGRVLGCLFAFEAPDMDVVERWMAEVPTQPNFAFICVLGKFLASQDIEAKRWEAKRTGEDTFAAFGLTLMRFLAEDNREEYVRCDSERYLRLLD